MSFMFLEYNSAQVKQRTNSKMIYLSYLDTLKSYNLNFRYKMFWQKHKSGYELLTKEHIKSKSREYLGRKSEDTMKIRKEFEDAKSKIKDRLDNLKNKLKREEKLNKLEGVVRAPKELVDIFAKINELGLDDKVISIGTNSLYVYEARAALVIEQEHLATRDIDLLNKKSKGISFLFSEIMSSNSALELLNSIDKSFEKSSKVPYRFINKDGVWVEFINPVSDSIKIESFKDNLFGEIIPLSMKGMQWLENSRLVKELVIAENGKCAFITTIHPLELAIYKNWLGKQEDRDYEKHIRDLQQSKLITSLMKNHMPDIDIEKDLKNMLHFKEEVVDNYMLEVVKVIND